MKIITIETTDTTYYQTVKCIDGKCNELMTISIVEKLLIFNNEKTTAVFNLKCATDFLDNFDKLTIDKFADALIPELKDKFVKFDKLKAEEELKNNFIKLLKEDLVKENHSKEDIERCIDEFLNKRSWQWSPETYKIITLSPLSNLYTMANYAIESADTYDEYAHACLSDNDKDVDKMKFLIDGIGIKYSSELEFLMNTLKSASLQLRHDYMLGQLVDDLYLDMSSHNVILCNNGTKKFELINGKIYVSDENVEKQECILLTKITEKEKDNIDDIIKNFDKVDYYITVEYPNNYKNNTIFLLRTKKS